MYSTFTLDKGSAKTHIILEMTRASRITLCSQIDAQLKVTSSHAPSSHQNTDHGKGQAYTMSILDTAPMTSGAQPLKYRTFIRVSFEDDERRSNFHSKGVKGIPVRLCAKTEIISTSHRGPPLEDRPEVCYCKIKLFQHHVAGLKFFNDVAHVKKIIDKLKQQISQSRFRSGFEEDLQTYTAMLSSTRPFSALNLKGDAQDDSDLFPVHLGITDDGFSHTIWECVTHDLNIGFITDPLAEVFCHQPGDFNADEFYFLEAEASSAFKAANSRMRVREQLRFCENQQKETAWREWSRLRYPILAWDRLDGRLIQFHSSPAPHPR
ncbi:hypothetical protein ACJ72_05326 [Emergomyces africanus]|uniref:Grh/CP2 DB domain-containing protein n=1 Tax=Emergomyces africanus TaxID=1955775 RepID=A0A1B7NU92_9EURO|nr:hypothetical protein ACJ72_05326 [Emergomyces africanus]